MVGNRGTGKAPNRSIRLDFRMSRGSTRMAGIIVGVSLPRGKWTDRTIAGTGTVAEDAVRASGAVGIEHRGVNLDIISAL